MCYIILQRVIHQALIKFQKCSNSIYKYSNCNVTRMKIFQSPNSESFKVFLFEEFIIFKIFLFLFFHKNQSQKSSSSTHQHNNCNGMCMKSFQLPNSKSSQAFLCNELIIFRPRESLVFQKMTQCVVDNQVSRCKQFHHLGS